MEPLYFMDVRQIAKLAHLEITEEEIELYTPQMTEIVNYIEQLNELETDNIEPMLGGLTEEGKATDTGRDDLVKTSLGQESALSEAPAGVAGHFQVPKVL